MTRAAEVMPGRYGGDAEGTEVNVAGDGGLLHLGEEQGQLRNLPARLLP